MKWVYLLFAMALIATAKREIASVQDIIEALKKFNVPREDIPHYICIANRSSGFNKVKRHYFMEEGYESYGLFQVNSTDACEQFTFPRGDCKAICESLATLYLEPQVECAIKLVNKYCFWKWHVWTRYCRRASEHFFSYGY